MLCNIDIDFVGDSRREVGRSIGKPASHVTSPDDLTNSQKDGELLELVDINFKFSFIHEAVTKIALISTRRVGS